MFSRDPDRNQLETVEAVQASQTHGFAYTRAPSKVLLKRFYSLQVDIDEDTKYEEDEEATEEEDG